MKLLWRMCAEPTLCFDGDSAGKKAAYRAVDTALPHLKPGHSVRFAFLPDGLDPDDLIRQQGAAAMADVLDKNPAADRRAVGARDGGRAVQTPEQRAALEARLKALSARSPTPSSAPTTSANCATGCIALGRSMGGRSSYGTSAAGSAGPPDRADAARLRMSARPGAAPDWRLRERTRLFGSPKRAQFLQGRRPPPGRQRRARRHYAMPSRRARP